VSTQLFEKLQKLFQDKVGDYYKLLEHNQNFIRFQGYFYLNSHLSELQEEYQSLGVGSLEFELYESVLTPILENEKITLRWLEDNKSELYENLTKCPSYKKLKTLLDWLNDENPSSENLRKAEQELIQSAEELKNELRKF
jgi:predicted nucleotidyltransferase